MNQLAFTLLREIYTLVRDDAAATAYQSLGQYRSALLRQISARIKTAVGPQPMTPEAIGRAHV